MELVKSANIRAIGYDKDKKELHVQFKNGGHYIYDGIGPSTHKDMLASDSIGGFLSKKIKGNHQYRKLG